jgi:hypothetical protein
MLSNNVGSVSIYHGLINTDIKDNTLSESSKFEYTALVHQRLTTQVTWTVYHVFKGLDCYQ